MNKARTIQREREKEKVSQDFRRKTPNTHKNRDATLSTYVVKHPHYIIIKGIGRHTHTQNFVINTPTIQRQREIKTR